MSKKDERRNHLYSETLTSALRMAKSIDEAINIADKAIEAYDKRFTASIKIGNIILDFDRINEMPMRFQEQLFSIIKEYKKAYE